MDQPNVEVVVNGDIIRPRSDHVGVQGQALRAAAREIEEAHDTLDELSVPGQLQGEPLSLSQRISAMLRSREEQA